MILRFFMAHPRETYLGILLVPYGKHLTDNEILANFEPTVDKVFDLLG